MNEDSQSYSRISSGRSNSRKAVSVRQFKIVSVQADYLVCHTWNGTVEGADNINIAKSPLLRNIAARNGITYTYTSPVLRTAAQGVTTETQVVSPAFVVGDVIFAQRGVVGDTGVTVAGAALQWIDQNLDGRAWAQRAP